MLHVLTYNERAQKRNIIYSCATAIAYFIDTDCLKRQ